MKVLTFPGPIALAALGVTAVCSTQKPNLEPFQENDMTKTPKLATLIHLTANDNRESELRSFLAQGRDMIAATEPETLSWHALVQESDEGSQAILDTFADGAGRQAHFDGAVAAALRKRAANLVHGGWEGGVLANVQHYEVLAAKQGNPGDSVAKATYIPIRALPGQANKLESLLRSARNIVAETEPGTVQWFALKLEDSENEFAIYDTFVDEDARGAHFLGQVAAALRDAAEHLVEDGWQRGVVAKVVRYNLNAIM